jgi:hypothetical protein
VIISLRLIRLVPSCGRHFADSMTSPVATSLDEIARHVLSGADVPSAAR